LVLPDSRPWRAAQAGAPHRVRRARSPAGEEGGVFEPRGAGGRPEENPRRGKDRGHAVLAAERDLLRFAGGCRNRGAGARAEVPRGHVRGPGAEIRSFLDARTVGIAPGGRTHRGRDTQGAFRRAAEHVREGRALTEYDLVQWMLGEFRAKGLETDDGPNASIGPSSGDPHYEPRAGTSRPIRAGELLLLDVWAKFARPDSVYYDITWMGYLGPEVPERFSKIFGVAREARDAAVEFVRNNVRAGRSIAGFEV